MEISASYWEHKIKIYGFQETTDMSLIDLAVNEEYLKQWGLCMNGLSEQGIHFHLALIERDDVGRIHICIVCHRKWENIITELFQNEIKPDAGESLQIHSPVELIYFQGPHFGDRYGIADAALRILIDNNITILASGCSGAVMYICFPEKSIEKAKQLLVSVFEVPRVVEQVDSDNSPLK
jgi:aspartokinase